MKTFLKENIKVKNTKEYLVDGMPCTEFRFDGDFSVEKTFDCGQCFRFDKVENSNHESEYSGIAFGKKISFAQDGDKYYIYGSDLCDFERIWVNYLALDLDYEDINRDILSRSENPALKEAMACGKGIRILRQDRWETVCSFIISQNNNIPRIKKIVAAMSEAFGEDKGNGVYAFPTPESLRNAGEGKIFELKTGFRAKYIYDAAERALDGRLSLEAPGNTTEECVKHLCEVKGIGPKVALCSLLFGFGRYDAFPIDVWIRRVMEKYFCAGFDPAELGPYAGIAQQYLFYYERYITSKQ